jgi:NAD(P)-dependent dehydrogenase (short-subunit alcohol dehydrogenase family)
MLIDALRINVLGPLNLTRAFLPLMRERKTGTILFVGSVGIYYAVPGANCYTGSKGLLEGLVPNLALEIAPFGIRTSILTFGNFRTELMAEGNIKYRAPNPLPVYDELNKIIQAGCAAQNQSQPGDPKKACEVVIEAVKGEGRCANKELPLRLPVGADAFDIIKSSCQERISLCKEWDGITSQTNVE